MYHNIKEQTVREQALHAAKILGFQIGNLNAKTDSPYGDISIVADYMGIGIALQAFFCNLDDRLVALEQHEELDKKRWIYQKFASTHLDEVITCLTKLLAKQTSDPEVICALSHLQKMQEYISSNIDSM
jgi:hypothetical protein